MTRLLFLGVVMAGSVWAASPRDKQRSRNKRSPNLGSVIWAGADFVFVDLGSVEGLTVGKQLLLTRNGRSSATCTVEYVADHSARCVGENVRVGDNFRVPRAEPEVSDEPTATDDEVRRGTVKLQNLSWQLRPFETQSSGMGGARSVQAALSHTTFFNANTERAATHQQRVDVLLSDVEVWKGLRATVDVTVLHLTTASGTRSLFVSSPVLLVRQLELGFRRPDIALSGGLGRSWLLSGGGLVVLDGAHASYRFSRGLEVGAFAGLLPQAGTLVPSLTQWAAGGFSRVQWALGEGTASSVIQLSGRAGYAVREQLGARFEAAVAASLWRGPGWDAHGSVEFGLGETQAPAAIDAARLDFGLRLNERLQLGLSGRYRGQPVSGLSEVGQISPGLQALHGDGFVSYELVPGLLASVRAGAAADFASSLSQFRGGAELALPSLLGQHASLGLGYFEEFGWLRGRSGYVSFRISASHAFRLISRTSLFHQQATDEAPGVREAEIGSSLSVEVSPWSFLGFRVLVVGRQNLGNSFAPFGSLGGQVWGAF